MKIRSLLLGTVAAAGLSTGAFATDLGVETGLDVCDDLGLTGLTISSDTNCLQISGKVKFEFVWGDYDDPDGYYHGFSTVNNNAYNVMSPTGAPTDYGSSFDSYLKFVATADSSFGPASAVIKFDLDQMVNNNTANAISQLYVSIGEGTVITAGLADSIFKDGDDEPLNFLGLFNSEAVDAGVIDVDNATANSGETGGRVLQIVSSMDNFWIGGALEGIGTDDPNLVGVVAYSTDDIKAHVSLAVDDVFNQSGDPVSWVLHSGFTGTFDTFKLVAAYGANDNGNGTAEQNGLISGSVSLDNFILAASAEFASRTGNPTEIGYGASISSEVSDGVTVKLGYRHATDPTFPDNIDQFAGQVVAAVSDEVTLTGEAGMIMAYPFHGNVLYGSGKVEWAPGGDFKASVKGEANSLGAYKITTDVEKSF